MSQPTADSIEDLTEAAVKELATADSLEALEQWRVAYLGRRGGLTSILRGLSQLELEQRRQLGALGNQAKNDLEQRLAQRTEEINQARQELNASQEGIDVTLPGRPTAIGRLHPTTQIIREISRAFVAMGFSF